MKYRTNCPWYIRPWHRRLRRIDEATVIASIIRLSSSPGQGVTAFQRFIDQTGQEHWHCWCSIEQRVRTAVRVYEQGGEWDRERKTREERSATSSPQSPAS